ncbi:hypothetical protein [Hoeflea sp.]|uniref:hypothetical protein n=1 Tax=Hoeflea sp. TaxID=1940281 RepID=UPI003B02772E
MRLLSIVLSQITVLFNTTRPEGQEYRPHVARELVDRYAFADAPQSFSDLNAERVEFRHGLFQNSAIESLEIYNDGVVVKARSDTDIIDAFLTDLRQWAEEEIGLTFTVNRTINRMYDSRLIIEADPKIIGPLSVMTDLESQIRAMVSENTGLDTEYYSAGFVLAPDQVLLSSLRPTVFRVERWFDSEFQLNKFVCIAPLRTQQHIRLLESLEGLS